MNRRTFVKVAVIGAVATSSACFGSFKATRWLYGVNKGISSSKFVQWLVFLGLVILPVYEIAGLIDVFILNSLEFWFGGSSTAQNEETERVVALDAGRTMTLRKDPNGHTLWVRIEGPGKSSEFCIEMTQDAARVRGADGELARATQRADGGIEVMSGGQLVESYAPAQVQDLLDTHDAEGSTASAAWAKREVASAGVLAAR